MVTVTFGSRISVVDAALALGDAQYVAQIAAVPEEKLKDASVHVSIVGCGDWKLIQDYKDTTGFKGEIFADPDRTLYRALGMTTETLKGTPSGEKRRSYLKEGILKNALTSIWRGPLKSPQHIGKQGNISQLGGEFIFGPGKSCSFASRMKNTEDHVEVADLMKSVGVAFP
ncbi:hypothetical protein EVG20_g9131 [Dentipellis fragilis]|uniref:Uncharacterized protein n=1 Tax=Dentipellis fragilis TaxID=205917 RepID=A0A4Y9Y2X1_9AGAM|nr:hypothetical protein EVG20_g9131 [Dentipellis fragilis]